MSEEEVTMWAGILGAGVVIPTGVAMVGLFLLMHLGWVGTTVVFSLWLAIMIVFLAGCILLTGLLVRAALVRIQTDNSVQEASSSTGTEPE